ncbi:hypothetical protein [Halopseudomonas aestusnigri]|uniref:hypothetical protein n=1 Tax=Halopseudomonas aestusnigri TaxID=857252 RepID=UPI003001EB42
MVLHIYKGYYMTGPVEELKERIAEVVSDADQLGSEISDYLAKARWINDRADNKSASPLGLGIDESPYGEEVARLEGVPEAVSSAAEALRSLLPTSENLQQVEDEMYRLKEVVDDAASTLDDLTPIDE